MLLQQNRTMLYTSSLSKRSPFYLVEQGCKLHSRGFSHKIQIRRHRCQELLSRLYQLYLPSRFLVLQPSRLVPQPEKEREATARAHRSIARNFVAEGLSLSLQQEQVYTLRKPHYENSLILLSITGRLQPSHVLLIRLFQSFDQMLVQLMFYFNHGLLRILVSNLMAQSHVNTAFV